MNALYLVDIFNYYYDGCMTMCYYYLMGRYMNVRWLRCEIVVALELHAGGLMMNKWYPWGGRIVRSN